MNIRTGQVSHRAHLGPHEPRDGARDVKGSKEARMLDDAGDTGGSTESSEPENDDGRVDEADTLRTEAVLNLAGALSFRT